MLDVELKEQVKGYFQKINKDVTILLHGGEHSSREELKTFLIEVAELSSSVKLKESAEVKTGIQFELLNESEQSVGIVFDGIPGGHEFSSFILAILQTGGNPTKLDDSITNAVGSIDAELEFETYISLDCHNCPEVVQTLNAFALANPKIKNRMIDGALFPEQVKERNIQGVPAVYLNGERFLSGKAESSKIFDKLMDSYKPKVVVNSKASPSSTTVYDVAVIGGGPSGVASAVYTARKGLKVIVIADRLGGQVRDTIGIENMISLPYTTGADLSATMAQQLDSNQIQRKENVRVNHIEPGAIKQITLNTGEVIQSKTIIISTGAKWRELNVPGEKENIGRGVAYCPHCDGPFFKNKDVIVVGGGNSGVEAALDLSGIVKSVTLIEFGNQLKADQILVDKLKSKANIEILVSTETKEILADASGVTSVHVQDRETKKDKQLSVDGIFIQIGLVPNSGFVKGLVETNNFGEILVDEKCKTNVEGIFACGDVTQTPYKQIIIAMGEGAKAAISAFEHLLHAA
jgi:alkyl hydroperoxide reductase subunit F